jgi:outer membrane protein TolC
VRALETLLGRYPSNELSTGATLPEMPGEVPAGIPSEVLERRPDVAAAERRVRGAFQNVQAKELAKLPRIALTSGIGVNSGLTDLTSRGGGFFNVGANFFAPVFDGGAREAEVRIATAEQEHALAAYGQTALKAFLDVENALGGEATLAEREALIAAAVRDAEEALRLRTLEADAGKADTLSVLQLQRQVFAGRSALVALRTARRSLRVDLHMALGGDFE